MYIAFMWSACIFRSNCQALIVMMTGGACLRQRFRQALHALVANEVQTCALIHHATGCVSCLCAHEQLACSHTYGTPDPALHALHLTTWFSFSSSTSACRANACASSLSIFELATLSSPVRCSLISARLSFCVSRSWPNLAFSTNRTLPRS